MIFDNNFPPFQWPFVHLVKTSLGIVILLKNVYKQTFEELRRTYFFSFLNPSIALEIAFTPARLLMIAFLVKRELTETTNK